MLCIRKPSDSDIRQYLRDRKEEPFQYKNVYGTRDYPTKTDYELDPKYKQFDIDQIRIKLGTGQQCFDKAVQALKQWKQFDLDWVEFCFKDIPILVGETVGVLSRQMGFWILSFCRINYVYDGPQEDGTVKFGFSYGTLKEHVEKGEERFIIEWLREPDAPLESGDVYFEMLSFSEPQHWMSQLGYPVARYFQNKFTLGSVNSMLKSVGSPNLVKEI